MSVDEIAAAHARRQVALGRRVAEEIGRMWRLLLDLRNIAASWARALPQAVRLLTTGQVAAASRADPYVASVLDAYRLQGNAANAVVPSAFGGVASDGRPLETLLYQPAIHTLEQIAAGVAPERAATSGAANLDMITRTQVADAGRVADGVAITTQPELTGYVRMLTLPSCSRCIILVGRRYEWNDGFERHPRCDCRHIPVAEDAPDDLRTDPMAAFASMTEAEQDKVFTHSGAQAIRNGSDISQVVNARRGMQRAAPFGRDLLVTTEGMTRRGLAGKRRGRRTRAARLMPEQIYIEANGDREEAIRLLKVHGYII